MIKYPKSKIDMISPKSDQTDTFESNYTEKRLVSNMMYELAEE